MKRGALGESTTGPSPPASPALSATAGLAAGTGVKPNSPPLSGPPCTQGCSAPLCRMKSAFLVSFWRCGGQSVKGSVTGASHMLRSKQRVSKEGAWPHSWANTHHPLATTGRGSWCGECTRPGLHPNTPCICSFLPEVHLPTGRDHPVSVPSWPQWELSPEGLALRTAALPGLQGPRAICPVFPPASPAFLPGLELGGSAALTSGLPGSIYSDLDGSMVGGHLGGVGEHSDGQCETLPWGDKGSKLAAGAFTTLWPPPCTSTRNPLLFRRADSFPLSLGLWVKFKLVGLACKGPGSQAPPHHPCSHVYSFLASGPSLMLFTLFRDTRNFAVQSKDGGGM